MGICLRDYFVPSVPLLQQLLRNKKMDVFVNEEDMWLDTQPLHYNIDKNNRYVRDCCVYPSDPNLPLCGHGSHSVRCWPLHQEDISTLQSLAEQLTAVCTLLIHTCHSVATEVIVLGVGHYIRKTFLLSNHWLNS